MSTEHDAQDPDIWATYNVLAKRWNIAKEHPTDAGLQYALAYDAVMAVFDLSKQLDFAAKDVEKSQAAVIDMHQHAVSGVAAMRRAIDSMDATQRRLKGAPS